MKAILMLIPVALALGAIGLVAFLWSLKSGQFEDLDGAANRILFDYDELDPPLTDDKVPPEGRNPGQGSALDPPKA